MFKDMDSLWKTEWIQMQQLLTLGIGGEHLKPLDSLQIMLVFAFGGFHHKEANLLLW